MGPQSFEGREHRPQVCGRQSFDPPGLVGNTGDLVQIPTHRAQRPCGVAELGELAVGERGDSPRR
jgi:hypothetical protein